MDVWNVSATLGHTKRKKINILLSTTPATFLYHNLRASPPAVRNLDRGEYGD